MGIKHFLAQYTPWPVRLMSRRLHALPAQMRDQRRNTQDVFTQIYAGTSGVSADHPMIKIFLFILGPALERQPQNRTRKT
jgi:hypothetical protein